MTEQSPIEARQPTGGTTSAVREAAPLRPLADPQERMDVDGRDWDVARYPPLLAAAQQALLDLPRAWYRQTAWRLPGDSSGSLLWAHADSHGLGGLIGALAMRGEVTDEELAERGRRRYLSNVLYYEQSVAFCYRLQQVARDLRLPLAFIKGPALVSQAYPDTGIRGFSDIDIVVENRTDARRLAEAVGSPLDQRSPFQAFRDRGRDPGRLHLMAAGWDLELACLMRHPCSPLFDLLQAHRDRVLRVPDGSGRLCLPDPEVHLVLLIQHLAQHMCSRLIWFLDLPVLVRAWREELDFDWVAAELERLRLLNVASRLARFCGDRFGEDIPLPTVDGRRWKGKFLDMVLSEQQITTGFLSRRHQSLPRRWSGHVVETLRYFLLTDSSATPTSTSPAKWSAATLLHVLNLKGDLLHGVLAKTLALIAAPVVRVFAAGISWRFHRRAQGIGS